MKYIKHVFAIASLLIIVGCTARYTHDVYNVNNAFVSNTHMTQEQVGNAIARSGKGLGWKMQKVRPGYMVGTLHLRTHVAKVNIYYSANTYSIKYAGSSNLTRRGMVHKNYNGWIHNLDNAIKSSING